MCATLARHCLWHPEPIRLLERIPIEKGGGAGDNVSGLERREGHSLRAADAKSVGKKVMLG